MRRGRRPKWMLKIAEERIDILFKLAEESYHITLSSFKSGVASQLQLNGAELQLTAAH